MTQMGYGSKGWSRIECLNSVVHTIYYGMGQMVLYLCAFLYSCILSLDSSYSLYLVCVCFNPCSPLTSLESLFWKTELMKAELKCWRGKSQWMHLKASTLTNLVMCCPVKAHFLHHKHCCHKFKHWRTKPCTNTALWLHFKYYWHMKCLSK